MKVTAILVQLCLLGSVSAVAAQDSPPPARKRVPQLTTDDLVPQGRTAPAAEGLGGGTGSWARRGLNDTGLSAELPRNAAAVELPFPDEIRAQAPASRAYA
ncbi:MAG TPA: hypothetical protein VFV34_05310, partial [Blastocatellia bacterium]|nr:hypothetical protein [Blastocatellia bacterium]